MSETYHHGALREALVTVALDLLESAGAPPSLREVARAAGVSAMAPYRHFADRGALLGAVSARGFARLREVLLVADSDGDPRAALIAQGRAYVDFALAHPALFRLMFSGEKSGGPPAGESAYTVLARRVAGLAPARAEVATLASWGLVHGLATLLLDTRLGALPPGAVDAAVGLLVDGITARGSTAAGQSA